MQLSRRDDRNGRILAFDTARLANVEMVDRPYRDAPLFERETQH
jgi:hypothetical protein